jgi:ribonuclease-3
LYLDQGFEGARQLVLRFVESESEIIHHQRSDRDAKSMLQELSQGQLQVTPLYRLVDTRGPDHAKEFTIEVVLKDKVYGRGMGKSKQLAEQDAARVALQALQDQISRDDHAALIALKGGGP